jgi:hypothetical protein
MAIMQGPLTESKTSENPFGESSPPLTGEAALSSQSTFAMAMFMLAFFGMFILLIRDFVVGLAR